MPLGDIPITQMSNNRSVHSLKRVNRFFYTILFYKILTLRKFKQKKTYVKKW